MIALYEKRRDDLTFRKHPNGSGHLGYAPHLHYHIELVIYLAGRTEAIADFEHCVIEGGDVYVAFPNQIHSYTTTGDESFYLFIINPDTMPELASVFSKSRPATPLIKGLARDPEILALAEKLSVRDPGDDELFKVRRTVRRIIRLFVRLLRFPLFALLC